MAKLNVFLKQHTPLIHFQAEQEGATLRATELKPKLDRFLVDYGFKKEFEKYKDFLIGDVNRYKTYCGDSVDNSRLEPAFDYKIKVKTKDVKVINLKTIDNSLFFGNIGKAEGDEIRGVFSDKPIELEFFSFNKNLLEIIKEKIAQFLAVTNFGTRQNKGFGSFYLAKEIINRLNVSNPEESFIETLKKVKERFLYFQSNKDQDYIERLDDIFIIYTLMKSGINFPRKNKSYHKSYLFKYMLEKRIGNEKSFIKRTLLEMPSKKTYKEKYVRGLLGVPEQVSFARNKKINLIGQGIERFASPITFKVVGKYVAIIPQEIHSDMFDRKFTFAFGKKEERISTPLKEEFNLEDFLSSFADYFNNDLEADSNNLNFLEKKLLIAKQKTIIKVGDSSE